MDWRQIYAAWKESIQKYPELQGPLRCRKVIISKSARPQYYDWVSKENEDIEITAIQNLLASGRPDADSPWSNGALRTAEFLIESASEEESSAILLRAFALTFIRARGNVNKTYRNAAIIEREAQNRLGLGQREWHPSSREFFPEFYIPYEVLFGGEEIRISALIELATMNAALVMQHYTPVAFINKDGNGTTSGFRR